ncbi:MAG: hypothetical protein N3A66_00470 [Planctomycetota bacterium]|nr:hypothetical protein [Planctomycetota bacterium]
MPPKSTPANGAERSAEPAAATALPKSQSRRWEPRASSRRSSLSAHAAANSRRDIAESQRKQNKNVGRQEDKTILYIAGGCIAAGCLLFVIYLLTSGGQRQAAGDIPREPAIFSAPPAGPYKTESEARQALAKAHQMFAEGANLAGDARNRHYRAAVQLCDNVLASNIGEQLREDANKLKYGAIKHMTLK